MQVETNNKLAHKLRRWLSRSRSSSARGQAVKSTKALSSGSFRFLALPREIRNMVYRELLLNTHPLIGNAMFSYRVMSFEYLWPLGIKQPHPPTFSLVCSRILLTKTVHLRRVHRFEAGTTPYPVILQANKQIHDEAAAVLYGENTWFSAAPIQFFNWADELYEPESSAYYIEPAPINTYLSWIRRFVLFPEGPPDWIRDKILKSWEVDSMLRRMGIHRQNLNQLVIGVASQEMSEEIVNGNTEWLENIDEIAMQRKFNWFTGRGTGSAYWLVSS